MNKDHSEDIERYLANEMSSEEQKAFNAELSQNPALREELQLWQDMEVSLRPDEEDLLRNNLQEIAKKHDTPDTKPTALQGIGWRWLFMFIGVLLLIWFGMKFLPADEASTAPDTPNTRQPLQEESSLKDSPSEATPIDIPSDKPSSETKETTNPNTNTTAPPAKQEEPERNLPIAANFMPNPQLESLIGQQLRSNNYTFNLNKPSISDAPSQISFRGTLETGNTPAELPPFQILLFNNTKEAYQNYKPLMQEKLSFQPAEGTLLSFNTKPGKVLQPGLYYYLIEDENSGMIYFADKVILN